MLHPEFGDEELFQQSRRIVIAEMQNIVFGHWLPVVLGERVAWEHRLRPDPQADRYSSGTDPSIRNAFSTAAFRFGHSMINVR